MGNRLLELPPATYQTIVGKETEILKAIKEALKVKLEITGDRNETDLLRANESTNQVPVWNEPATGNSK